MYPPKMELSGIKMIKKKLLKSGFWTKSAAPFQSLLIKKEVNVCNSIFTKNDFLKEGVAGDERRKCWKENCKPCLHTI
jgi:hypothetical protein